MKTVNIKAAQLLQILTENRKIHVEEYQESLEGYRQKVKAAAEELITKCEPNMVPDLDRLTRLVQPECHKKDYSTAMRMAELSADETVELSEHEFKQLVMDEWSWKDRFEMTKTLYNN